MEGRVGLSLVHHALQRYVMHARMITVAKNHSVEVFVTAFLIFKNIVVCYYNLQ